MFFAGISWKDKVADLRLKMAERNVMWFVVTALDEIACECHVDMLPHLSFDSLGICVLRPLSSPIGQGIPRRLCHQMVLLHMPSGMEKELPGVGEGGQPGPEQFFTKAGAESAEASISGQFPGTGTPAREDLCSPCCVPANIHVSIGGQGLS